MPAPPDRAPAPQPNKWLVTVAVLLGTFMAVMDVSVVNVAMPHMMGTFGVNLSTITWVATAYSIAQIIVTTMAGWLSTLLGRKRYYMISFVVFIAGSILAGTARTFTEMLVYRTIQGIGGGSLVPVSQAILREAFPPRQQSMAMAFYGMGVVLAPGIGPVFGGWLTDAWGWPWIFYINVPVSIVALVMVFLFVRDPPYLRRGVRRIDQVGIILLMVGLTALQLVMERGHREQWFQSHWIILGTVVAGVALVALAIWEFHAKEPVVNLRLLGDSRLAAGTTMGLLFGVVLFGTTFIIPQFTQQLLGYPAFQSGLVLLPRAITLFIMMPVAGFLYRYLDARALILGGIGLIFWAYYMLSQLSLDAGYDYLIIPLLVMGAGMPFMFVTLTTVALSRIPNKDMTDATSLYTLSRLIGGNVGYALVATLVADGTQTHRNHLVQFISALNPRFLAFHEQAAAYAARYGYDPAQASAAAYAVADLEVNRQAAVMAYSDAAWIMGLLFVATVPLVFLLPGRIKEHRRAAAAAA